MADLDQPSQQTSGTTPQNERAQNLGSDLSTLSVAPSFMEAEPARIPSHTSESIRSKWGSRSFDTGVVIQGRIVGGPR